MSLRDDQKFDRIWAVLIVCIASAAMGLFAVPRLLTVPLSVILIVGAFSAGIGVMVAASTRNMPVFLVRFGLVMAYLLGILAGVVMNG